MLKMDHGTNIDAVRKHEQQVIICGRIEK